MKKLASGGIRYGAVLTVFFTSVFFSVAAQKKYLLLPVELMIENGTIEKSVVKVIKNGAVAFSLPGRATMRLKLDFNTEYVVSFSKEGYITKSIAVSTAVPPERMLQVFAPYKIGVKIFKQYEGVNIVVYSQPVAKIHYNPFVDDFDYDVDYTKSILSVLTATEHELEIRAAEERRVLSLKQTFPESEDADDKTKYPVANATMKESRDKHPENKNPEKQIISREYPVTNRQDNRTPESGIESPPVSQPVPGNEDRKNTTVQAGDEVKASTFNQGNDRQGSDATGNKGTDLNAEIIPGIAEDPHNASLIAAHGFERGEKIYNEQGDDIYIESVRNSGSAIYYRSTWKESNRTVTVIKIVDGNKAAEYRKVDYNWGGLYYFKDLHFTISRDVYEWATGEK